MSCKKMLTLNLVLRGRSNKSRRNILPDNWRGVGTKFNDKLQRRVEETVLH